jgi:hypothetical protein
LNFMFTLVPESRRSQDRASSCTVVDALSAELGARSSTDPRSLTGM